MPLVRPLAHKFGAKPEPRAQPKSKALSLRRGGAPPHISRRSRRVKAKIAFVHSLFSVNAFMFYVLGNLIETHLSACR